jgi:hypothetical protein
VDKKLLGISEETMRFFEFLKICKAYLMDDMSVHDFMSAFFAEITACDEGDALNETCPFQKISDKSKAKKVFYGERELSKKDAIYVKSHFDEEAFMSLIESRPDYIQQNLIDELKRHKIEVDFSMLTQKMCSMFREYMDDILDRKTEKQIAKVIKEESDVPTKQIVEDSVDSETLKLARNFCIDFEEQRDLIILCQMAKYIDPLHKHVRPMYTEYLRQSEEVQREIMSLCNIPMLQFEEGWEYKYLDMFRDDIKRLELVTEKDLLYDGGKYFHRAKRYAEIEIDEYNTRIFPVVHTKCMAALFTSPYGDLLNYIDEYLYYQGNEEAMKTVGQPPFDWMIDNLGLLSCPEEDLTYWMCVFIYSACMIIPREIKKEKRIRNDFSIPQISDAKYMEDLYYSALMALYELYC